MYCTSEAIIFRNRSCQWLSIKRPTRLQCVFLNGAFLAILILPVALNLLYPTVYNISQSIVVSCISHLISPYVSTFHTLQSTIFLNQLFYLTLIDPSSTFPLKCLSLHSSQFNVPPSLLLLYFSTVYLSIHQN